MNIEIEMSGFDAVLNEAMKIVAPETLEAANRESGEYLRDYLASWYDNKGREHWVNNSLPTHGPGRMSTGWFSNIARKWFLSSADASGAVITHPDEDRSLRHNLRGGTITAKNAGALTIPLVPEAPGRRAADYRSAIGELFTIPNKSALFEAVEGGGVRAVYALRQSITQDPWPDAIPASEELAAAYGIKLMDVLAASLDA